MPELRALYPIPTCALLHVVLVPSFVLGVISVCLRRSKTLGATGIALTLVAALLGGSRVPVDGEIRSGPFLGARLVPAEPDRLLGALHPAGAALRPAPDQPVFRRDWRTDLTYFFVSCAARPGDDAAHAEAGDGAASTGRARPRSRPGSRRCRASAQFAAILVLTDLTQYWVHRLFHRVPALWRFHAVHHSAETMDWLAGSRLHLVDVAVTRGLTYVPDLRPRVRGGAAVRVRRVRQRPGDVHPRQRAVRVRAAALAAGDAAVPPLAPRADPAAVDKNFAVHLPSSTACSARTTCRRRWPAAYGIAAARRCRRIPGAVRPSVPPASTER